MATKAEIATWDLYILYCSLEDGIAWNIQGKVATFESKWSARQFKKEAGDGWTVRYENSITNRKKGKIAASQS